MATTTTDRRRTLGARGESIAGEHLAALGYRVVERNFRTRYGELDLVALGHGCLVFCEVKTRVGSGLRGPARPLDAVGPAKQRQLRRMAAQWLNARGSAYGAPDLRFDAIGINLSPTSQLLALEHVENAF